MHQELWTIGGAGVLTIASLWLLIRKQWLSRPAFRAVAPVEPTIWLLGTFMLFLAPTVGGTIINGLPEARIGPPESLQRIGITQGAGYLVALAIALPLVAIIRRRVGVSPCATGLCLRPRDLWLGAALLLLLVPLYVLVSQSAMAISELIAGKQPPVKHETLRRLVGLTKEGTPADPGGSGGADSLPWRLLVIFCVTILAPTIEELTYRGFLQSFFLRLVGGPMPPSPTPALHPPGTPATWLAVAATSAVFAPMHAAMGAVPWSAVPGLFALSLAMGWAFEKTGRLGVPIVMHILFNIANIALAIWTANSRS